METPRCAGATGIGDPCLASVDDVAVTLGSGDGTHRLQVRSSARLGERHRGSQFPSCHARQILLLLFLGPELHDQLGHNSVSTHCARQAHPPSGEFLGDLHVAGHRHCAVAVRFGDRETEDTDRLHRVDEFFRVLVGVLQVMRSGLDLLLDEVLDGLDQGGFLGIQREHW